MTDKQKEEIRNLRENGLGYKKIAAQLGITENAVKSFCHRNNLAGRKKPQIPKCKCCGNPIPPVSKRRPRKFCCKECKQKWWNSNRNHPDSRNQIEKTCPSCGSVFISYASDNRKYCSHSCYIKKRFKGGDLHEPKAA